MYNTLEGLIDQYIIENTQGKITGTILNDVLNEMVSQLGSGSRFGGAINPASNVPQNDYDIFYFASSSGVYVNFDSIEVLPTEIAFVRKERTSWVKYSWNISSLLANKQDTIVDLDGIRIGASAGATAYQKPQSGIPKTDLATDVQASLEKADTAIPMPSGGSTGQVLKKTSDGVEWANESGGGGSATDVQINGTSITSNDVANIVTEGVYNASTNKIATMSDLPSVPVTDVTVGGTSVVSSGTAVIPAIPDVTGKADKVSNATSGNFAALDSNGNLTDSGKNATDFALLAHGISSITSQQDGSLVFTFANGDTTTVDLNHTHPNMAKLIVCEESDLPSTLDNSTIYAITDSGETEIEKLIIRGMEFAGGGGTPSTEPKIVSPIGTQIDFNGESTKTVTVKATNLSEALTIVVTGVTANLQTISANDAANGVQLILTKDQNFVNGTLRIYSSEVDKSWYVIDSQAFQLLTAIKLTGTQWLKTDYVPKTTTEFEMLVKFGDRNVNNTFSAVLTTNVKPAPSGDPYLFRMNTDVVAVDGMALYFGNAKSQTTSYGIQGFENLTEQQMLSDNTLISYTLGTDTNNNPCGIFRFGSLTHFTSLQASDMGSPIMIGYGRTTNAGSDNIFNRYSLTIYRFTITEGGTTVRNYVPVTFGGVPGLRDQVTGTFISSETSTPVVAIE